MRRSTGIGPYETSNPESRRVRARLRAIALGLAVLVGSTGCISIELLGNGSKAPLVESVVRCESGGAVQDGAPQVFEMLEK